jgi:hypothetical protein
MRVKFRKEEGVSRKDVKKTWVVLALESHSEDAVHTYYVESEPKLVTMVSEDKTYVEPMLEFIPRNGDIARAEKVNRVPMRHVVAVVEDSHERTLFP